MTTSFMTLLQKSASNVIRLGLFGTIAVTLPSAAYAQATNDSGSSRLAARPHFPGTLGCRAFAGRAFAGRAFAGAFAGRTE
jgi:hypothetical protein